MTDINLNQSEIDQLKEITNIGAGNAATALSHMISERVEISVPESFVGGAEMVERKLGKLDEKVLAIFFKTHGDIEGAMIMILPPQSAVDFAHLMTKEEIKSLDEVKQNHISALQEMGNILLGASVTALNKFLNVNIIHSIPDAAIDMLGSVMDEVLSEIGDERGDILVFKITMSVKEKNTVGDLYYLLDPKSSAELLRETAKKLQ